MSKEQLKLHFDFGRHGRAEDAESLRECVRRLKPGILVIETAFVEEGDRKSAITEMNGKIKEARKTDIGASLLIDEMCLSGGMFEWPEFARAQLGIALSEPGLGIHIVEGSKDGESLGDMFVLPFMMNGPGAALKKLYEGDESGALSAAVKSFRDINDLILVKRNDLIVEGFLRLPQEIPELHPGLSGTVTVVARYGATHADIMPRLVAAGFDAEAAAMPGLDHSSELAIRYSMDASMQFTRSEAGAILFDYAFGNAFGEMHGSMDQDARDSRLLLEGLGGGEGFVASSIQLARASPSMENFFAQLRNLFAERLAQKGIYYTSAL